MQRHIRRNIDYCLTGLGIGIILCAVVLGASLEIVVQLPMALIGVLIMEAGVWRITTRLFPNERHYTGLRSEGDHMIELIRELNSAAIAKETGQEDAKRFQETLQAMHDSVTKMSELAARNDGKP